MLKPHSEFLDFGVKNMGPKCKLLRLFKSTVLRIKSGHKESDGTTT
jgi:hypothetical protein